MKNDDLRKRTKEFALSIIKLFTSLSKYNSASRVIGKQMLRSGTSVGANYREGCRSRSTAEFSSKLGICLQEIDETLYWLELLQESSLVDPIKIDAVHTEADELSAIFAASLNTIKRNKSVSPK